MLSQLPAGQDLETHRSGLTLSGTLSNMSIAARILLLLNAFLSKWPSYVLLWPGLK